MTNLRSSNAGIRLPGIVAALGLTVIGATATSRPASPFTATFQCPTATPAASVTIANFKRSLSTGDANSSSLKTSVGLTGVDSSSVTIVTDSIVCTRVTHAIDSAFKDTSTASYFVLHAGTSYVAFPHLQPVHSLFFVDSNFTYVGVTLY
jgi:hypothetical protein